MASSLLDYIDGPSKPKKSTRCASTYCQRGTEPSIEIVTMSAHITNSIASLGTDGCLSMPYINKTTSTS